MNHTTHAQTPAPQVKGGGKALLTGGLAALLASACCLGPLVLIMVGISGAWIVYLTALEPYQPIFMGAAIVALFFAARQIWRPAAACEPGQVCATPVVRRTYKILFGVVVLLLAAAMGFPLIASWFY
ncbi:mercuric ion transporter MerT [Hydrogenophaga sp.]|uniref:mercuric ion transporter MerT n=1 Tax=Hydrogenophaga sp. TaxID=1904254 RepID=UPI003564F1EB